MAEYNINLGIFAVAGGSADVITAAYTPTTLAFYNGLYKQFRASGANTVVAPTLNVDGLGAKPIVKKGGNPLVVGDIAGAGHVCEVSYNSTSEKWELLNPASDEKDTYWQAGAGANSLMDKRSTTGSGVNGFTAGNNAVNTTEDGQAVGANASNTGIAGQAIGSNAVNTGDSGQAIGQTCLNEAEVGQAVGANASNTGIAGQAIGASAVNSGQNGQAIGESTNNSGSDGQAVGHEAVNEFARSTALGHQSVSTADDQMNLAQTVRLQDYTGGDKLLILDADKLVVETTAIPNNTTATTQSANDNSTKVATTAYVKTAVDNKSEFFGIACSDETTVLAAASTSVPVATMHVPYAMTLTKVYAGLRTAGTGAAVVTVDIHVNGTTIMSATKILFTASQKLSADGVLTTTALAAGDYVEIFLDQRDTDNVATGLKTYLVGHQ